MNFNKKIIKKIIYITRNLQDENNKPLFNQTSNNDSQEQQLRDLYIYIAVLIIIIIIILGVYALYRKCVEKKVLKEFEDEYELILLSLLNSNCSQNSSQEDKHPHSYNQINENNAQNYENELGSPNVIYSIENSHEQRMENFRKKYGNTLVIKCLLKKQIEEIRYTKKIAEEYKDNCSICQDNIIENSLISRTPCEHIFHKKCFDKYLKEIQKRDKLLCPNCNQNLLINKKFLKLRVKTQKFEVKNKKMNKKECRERELNLENEIKNRNSIVTNKNEDINYNNNNEIIFINKKYKKDINKLNDNKNINNINVKKKKENNIYNPLEIKIGQIESEIKKDKDKIMPCIVKINNEEKKEGECKNMIIIHNFNDKNSCFKNNLNSNKLKSKLNNNKRLNLNDINSERERIFLSKNTFSPFISSIK